MRTPFFSFILYKVGVTMERFVLQKYTFRFGLAIRFVLRIIQRYGKDGNRVKGKFINNNRKNPIDSRETCIKHYPSRYIHCAYPVCCTAMFPLAISQVSEVMAHYEHIKPKRGAPLWDAPPIISDCA